MKAVIYSRFSTDRQTESSIADQVRVCTEFAKREGWRIVDCFEDQGISAAALGNRPGVLAMRDAALAGKFDVLLVMDISRLSRSMGDVAKLTERLVFAGRRVVAVHDNADTAREGWEMQFGLAGLIGQHFRKMVAKKTHAALQSRALQKKSTGGKAYGYVGGAIDSKQAKIVVEAFQRFSTGESCRDIAADLSRRGIPSPGSSWNREVRRASGWMGSAIRAMLRNERYTGQVVWNKTEWRKDPDSGRRICVERPRSQWIEHRDESLRIVTDELFERAQKRFRADPDSASKWSKAGGKPRFLLSGLLVCEQCDSHYVMVSGSHYGCSGAKDGSGCSNFVRIRRDRAEAILLDPIRRDLLSPDRIRRMAKEMQRAYVERHRASAAKAAERPAELAALDARLDRLRERLKAGDPDLSPEDLAAAIARGEKQRRELEAAQPAEKHGEKILRALPKAAELYRQQIAKGLDGDVRAAAKARIVLKQLFGGKIRLVPEREGGLVAHWNLHRSAVFLAEATSGSGGRI